MRNASKQAGYAPLESGGFEATSSEWASSSGLAVSPATGGERRSRRVSCEASAWADTTPDAELFSHLVRVLLPNGGFVISIDAYFDESETEPFACVSGYAFHSNRAIELDQEWKKVLDDHEIEFFRMADCAVDPGFDQFKGMDKDERILIERKLIELIKQYMIFGFSASVDKNILPSLPQFIPINNWYSLCCYFCLMSISKCIQKNNIEGDAAYFFEAGSTHQADASNLMNAISNDVEWGSLWTSPASVDSFRA